MTEEERKSFFVDGAVFNENWNNLLSHEVMKYAGQCVAYSVDGTSILAHGNSFEEVWKDMRAAGLDPEKAVYDQLYPADVDCILPSLQDADQFGDARATE